MSKSGGHVKHKTQGKWDIHLHMEFVLYNVKTVLGDTAVAGTVLLKYTYRNSAEAWSVFYWLKMWLYETCL